MTGTTLSPSGTGSLPPGQKSFCTSITSRTSLSSIFIGVRFQSLLGSAYCSDGRFAPYLYFLALYLVSSMARSVPMLPVVFAADTKVAYGWYGGGYIGWFLLRVRWRRSSCRSGG